MDRQIFTAIGVSAVVGGIASWWLHLGDIGYDGKVACLALLFVFLVPNLVFMLLFVPDIDLNNPSERFAFLAVLGIATIGSSFLGFTMVRAIGWGIAYFSGQTPYPDE